ncbi:MAG TPA: hypothetical protein VN641_06715 [Urbifossiella sp.]|nr:hypothetical protein [Urbifossiella sp.]
MQRRGAAVLIVGLAALLAAAPTATAQNGQAYYWPHRKFDIPVNVDRINKETSRPTHLQLFSSLNRGRWQAGAKLPISGLEDIGNGKKGFQFNADRDGEYEFSVMYWYASGDSSPRSADELGKMLAVTIDTTPPVIRIVAGANGVRWEATDDNLDTGPKAVTLEAKLSTWSNWKTVSGPFKTSDSYAWQLKGQLLDVRVSARDKAGNEVHSAIVRVPGTDAIGTSFPRSTPGTTPDWPPGPPAPRDPVNPATPIGNLPKPRIEYVSGNDITVNYEIQKAGRSGVQAAELYVQKDSGPWQLEKRFNIDPPAPAGKTLSMAYRADKEGLYGFFVAPESGARTKAPPPRRDDPPMLYVVVDRTAPYVKITDVRVSPGARGPVVEIAWETTDQNLMPDPITLEYSVDKDAAVWKEIKYRLPPGTERPDNVGQRRYVGDFKWEVQDETLWKFHARIRSVDRAGNTGKDQWKNEVIVDLDVPSAGITGVRGSAGTGSDSPASSIPAPAVPFPSPAKPPVPKPSKPIEEPTLPDIP